MKHTLDRNRLPSAGASIPKVHRDWKKRKAGCKEEIKAKTAGNQNSARPPEAALDLYCLQAHEPEWITQSDDE